MSAGSRWVVTESDGTVLEEVLARLGDPGASKEGRAFVNGRRASVGDRVVPGDAVEVWSAREAFDESPRILARRRGLVLAYKPAGLPSEADRRGSLSLSAWLEQELGGHAHLASRLDLGVSGVVLAAIGEEAQRHVARQQAEGRVERSYMAIAGGRIEGRGSWRGAVRVGGRTVPAETRFEAVAHARPARRGDAATTLLRLWPITGRTHQLRLHAEQANAPLLGCREHGGARSIVLGSGAVRALDRVALHAISVELPDERGESFSARAEVPASLRATWMALDGLDDAWDERPAS